MHLLIAPFLFFSEIALLRMLEIIHGMNSRQVGSGLPAVLFKKRYDYLFMVRLVMPKSVFFFCGGGELCEVKYTYIKMNLLHYDINLRKCGEMSHCILVKRRKCTNEYSILSIIYVITRFCAYKRNNSE